MQGELNPSDPVEDVSGVGNARGESLRAEGYETVEDLQRASQKELAGIIPGNIARDVKERVGDEVQPQTSIAQAKENAQSKPGAKAKIVRVDGEQVPKVLELERRENLAGATMTVRKG